MPRDARSPSRATAGAPVEPIRSTFARWLGVGGIVAVGASVLGAGLPSGNLAAFTLTLPALAAWLVQCVARTERMLVAASFAMTLLGALAAADARYIPVAIMCVGLASLTSRVSLSIWPAVATDLLAIAVVGVRAAWLGHSAESVVAATTFCALGVVVGFGRRQSPVAEAERIRIRMLDDRARAARDIHDVLAHSLGGLVLQLDAIEAQLDAGEIAPARERAAAARELAASGLVEARRAVRTLREGDEPPPSAEARHDALDDREQDAADTTLAQLVAAHRSFGATIEASGPLTLDALDADARRAAIAIVREALSNARRHAPGARVSLDVRSDGYPPATVVSISNSLRAAGMGIIGMRERIDELGDGSTVAAAADGDRFVVEARFAGHAGRTPETSA